MVGHESKDKVPVMNTLKYFMGVNLVKVETSIDVLPSKNQALCKYCSHVSI